MPPDSNKEDGNKHQGSSEATWPDPLVGHTGDMSPAGDRRVSGFGSNWVTVWDVKNGERVLTFQPHDHTLHAAAWGPRGQRLATADCAGEIKIWRVSDGCRLHATCVHTPGRQVETLAWSRDGRRLASGGSGPSVKIWDTKDGRELCSLVGHTESINDVAWSPDGTRLASAGRNGGLIVWDAGTGSEVASLRGRAPFSRVRWSGDGRRLMAHSGGQSYWDNANGTWSADGRHLITGSGTMTTWDASSGYDYISSTAYARQRARALYSRGLRFARTGRTRESDEVFREARELDAASPIAYVSRGNTHEERGEIAEALADYTQAIRLEPDLATPYRRRARLQLQRGNLEAALRDAVEAVRLAPRERDNWHTLGLLQFRTEKWDAAKASLEKSRELSHGDEVDALLLLATTHWKLGETDAAQQCYQKALERITQHDQVQQDVLRLRDEAASKAVGAVAEALWRLRSADRFWNRAQYSQALEENHRAVALLEQHAHRSQEQSDVRDHLAKAYLSLGQRLYGLEQREEAKKILEKVRHAFPNRAEYGDQLADTYKRQDSAEVEHDNPGIARLSRSIRLNPDSAEAFLRRAKVWDRSNDDRAIADFTRAIQLAPADPELYLRRGYVYLLAGRWRQAVADFDECIRFRGSAQDFGHRACAYFFVHEYDKAVNDCNEAIRLDPTYWEVYVERSRSFLFMGKFDEALRDLDRARVFYHSGLSPYSPYGWRGHLYKETGDLEKALADFTQHIRNGGMGVGEYAYRAVIYAALGRTEEARADIDKAVQILPKNPHQMALAAAALANLPGELRRVERALELAEQAVKGDPKRDDTWEALGMAQYRSGQWQAAADALTKSIEVSGCPSVRKWLFLAMAHWQLGEKDEARRCYQRAVERLKTHEYENQELRGFRAEAAELLGIDEQQDTTGDSKPQPEATQEDK